MNRNDYSDELLKYGTVKQITLDSLLMQEAAESMGLTTHRLDRKTFTVHHGAETLTVWWTRRKPFPDQAKDVVTSKVATKAALEAAGVKAPKGVSALFENGGTPHDVVGEYLSVADFPLTVKPIKGTGGIGVQVNIRSAEEVDAAVRKIKRMSLPGKKLSRYGNRGYLLEEYLKGKELRAYVAGDEVIGAWTKEPAYVIGDGESTIDSLLVPWELYRSVNPRLWYSHVRPDRAFLAEQGKSLSTVPDEGEKVVLSPFGSVAKGAPTQGVLDSMSNSVKKAAVDAVKSIEGLEVAGVDMIVRPGFGRQANSVLGVLEMNSAPSIGNAHFPVFGNPTDVATPIMKHYIKKAGWDV